MSGPVCGKLFSEPAQAPFAAAAGASDCAGAVRALAAQVDDPAAYARGRAPSNQDGDVLTVDACRLQWTAGATPGPQLGVLTVGRIGAETTYVVTAFRALFAVTLSCRTYRCPTGDIRSVDGLPTM